MPKFTTENISDRLCLDMPTGSIVFVRPFINCFRETDQPNTRAQMPVWLERLPQGMADDDIFNLAMSAPATRRHHNLDGWQNLSRTELSPGVFCYDSMMLNPAAYGNVHNGHTVYRLENAGALFVAVVPWAEK